MSKIVLGYLNRMVEHMEYYNNHAPFPVYDTDFVKDVHKKIKEVKLSKEDYDKLPVTACSLCNNLHTEVDELENDICMRCGSINEITVYNDIFEYIKETEEDADGEY